MAQDNTPAIVMYTGTGSQTRFDVPFDKGSYGTVKVLFVRRGETSYEWNPTTFIMHGYLYAWNGGVYTTEENAVVGAPLYDKNGNPLEETLTADKYREPKNDIFSRSQVEWIGDTLTTDDVICIVRTTEKDQPFTYPNNQKPFERALDNLSRQVQELKEGVKNSLKVDPSWMGEHEGGVEDDEKMNPVDWLQTIIRCKDLSIRGLRWVNGWLEYSREDQDVGDVSGQVWTKLVNTPNITHIRERVIDETRFVEYSIDNGVTWRGVITVDSELNAQSLNAVQNKAVTEELEKKANRSELPVVGNGKITIKQAGVTKGEFNVNQNADLDIELAGGLDDVVTSVNGQRGDVVLTASGVGAATAAQGAKADTAVQPGDLATVATSGSYSDLSNAPTIINYQAGHGISITGGDTINVTDPLAEPPIVAGEYTLHAVVESDGSYYNKWDLSATDPYTKAETDALLANKADDTNVVHKSGTETVGGEKTFTSNLKVLKGIAKAFLDSTDVPTLTDRPVTSGNLGSYEVRTGSGDWLSLFKYNGYTNGNHESSMQVRGEDGTQASISVGVAPDGTAYSVAPECAQSNSIVTTLGHTKASNGYYKLGNGLIVQWLSSVTISQGATITFPTAFTNETSYAVVPISISQDDSYPPTIGNKTSTTVNIYRHTGMGPSTYNIIAIGY